MPYVRIVVAALFLAFSAGAGAQPWTPQKNVEIVVGSAPGGINDRTARVVEKILADNKLVNTPITEG